MSAAGVARPLADPLHERLLVIEPRGASRIYATVAGEISEALSPGTEVQAGQVVARLENLTLKRDLARL